MRKILFAFLLFFVACTKTNFVPEGAKIEASYLTTVWKDTVGQENANWECPGHTKWDSVMQVSYSPGQEPECNNLPHRISIAPYGDSVIRVYYIYKAKL